MLSHLSQAVTKTIIYADIFDYPLVLDEIRRYLIKVKSLPAGEAGQKSKVKSAIKNSKVIKEKDGYYFLNGRENILAERISRKKYSIEKLEIARKTINLLKLIPTIKLIGITGALAMLNDKEKDDIDLFIITSSRMMWTTRLLVTLLIEITGRRRHPQENNINNKICLNMFVDENHLEIPKKEQDLFSAHEVLQMKSIFDRENTYQKFLNANNWVSIYLPNAFKIKNQKSLPRQQAGKIKKTHTTNSGQAYKKSKIFSFIETSLKKIQLWYMWKRRTKEIIQDSIIRFHPSDAREWILIEYKKRLRKINL